MNFLFVNVRQHPRQGKKGDIILQKVQVFQRSYETDVTTAFELRTEPDQP